MIVLAIYCFTLSLVSPAAVPSSSLPEQGVSSLPEQRVSYLTERGVSSLPEQGISSSWLLPNENSTLSKKESLCLSKELVFWPRDGQCYSLLTQGPCDSREWLVIDKSPGGERVRCKERVCSCNSRHPSLCEVELDKSTNSTCRCKVSLAAAQDGICDIGEQLMVSPYGVGVCDCVSSPPHGRWSGDDNCYPLYARGPCLPGYVLAYSQERFELSCKPALCGEGLYLWVEDGKCHALGSQGPCDEAETFQVDGDSLEVGCKTNKDVARVYDIIPFNQVSLNTVVVEEVKLVNMDRCFMDSRGKCRKVFSGFKKLGRRARKNRRRKAKKVNPKSYLKWLAQFI